MAAVFVVRDRRLDDRAMERSPRQRDDGVLRTETCMGKECKMVQEVEFKGKRVTRQDILAALQDYDQAHPYTHGFYRWLENRDCKCVLMAEHKAYPPKHILSRATGISTEAFSGDEETNRVFRELGFTIREIRRITARSD